MATAHSVGHLRGVCEHEKVYCISPWCISVLFAPPPPHIYVLPLAGGVVELLLALVPVLSFPTPPALPIPDSVADIARTFGFDTPRMSVDTCRRDCLSMALLHTCGLLRAVGGRDLCLLQDSTPWFHSQLHIGYFGFSWMRDDGTLGFFPFHAFKEQDQRTDTLAFELRRWGGARGRFRACPPHGFYSHGGARALVRLGEVFPFPNSASHDRTLVWPAPKLSTHPQLPCFC